jgi:hypothetical protein
LRPQYHLFILHKFGSTSLASNQASDSSITVHLHIFIIYLIWTIMPSAASSFSSFLSADPGDKLFIPFFISSITMSSSIPSSSVLSSSSSAAEFCALPPGFRSPVCRVGKNPVKKTAQFFFGFFFGFLGFFGFFLVFLFFFWFFCIYGMPRRDSFQGFSVSRIL